MMELLYHLGMLDMKDELLAHSYISTCMMPYITSQFMPRKIADRPKVVPTGCTNLAFIGQFIETKEDAVFTVETSCRTAMQAVYQLSGIEKKQLTVVPTFYDIRYLLSNIKKQKNIDTFTNKDLPNINLLNIKQLENKILTMLNQIEQAPSMYPGKDSPKNT
jgi:oleate hydratase